MKASMAVMASNIFVVSHLIAFVLTGFVGRRCLQLPTTETDGCLMCRCLQEIHGRLLKPGMRLVHAFSWRACFCFWRLCNAAVHCTKCRHSLILSSTSKVASQVWPQLAQLCGVFLGCISQRLDSPLGHGLRSSKVSCYDWGSVGTEMSGHVRLAASGCSSREPRDVHVRQFSNLLVGVDALCCCSMSVGV